MKVNCLMEASWNMARTTNWITLLEVSWQPGYWTLSPIISVPLTIRISGRTKRIKRADKCSKTGTLSGLSFMVKFLVNLNPAVKGIGLAFLVSSLFLSTSIVFAKKNIKKIHPAILTLNRVVFLFTFAVIAVLVRQENLAVPGSAIFNTIAGSTLGPFLTGLAQYSALKYIEASRTMIIQTTRGLFVLIGSMIYLSILPTWLQVFGGVVTIVGVIILSWGKIKKPQKT